MASGLVREGPAAEVHACLHVIVARSHHHISCHVRPLPAHHHARPCLLWNPRALPRVACYAVRPDTSCLEFAGAFPNEQVGDVESGTGGRQSFQEDECEPYTESSHYDDEDDFLSTCPTETQTQSEGTSAASRARRKQAAKLFQATPRQKLAIAMRLSEMSEVETFWDPTHDTKAVLGWNRHTIILAFRGTKSLRNALSDIKVKPSLAIGPGACVGMDGG